MRSEGGVAAVASVDERRLKMRVSIRQAELGNYPPSKAPGAAPEPDPWSTDMKVRKLVMAAALAASALAASPTVALAGGGDHHWHRGYDHDDDDDNDDQGQRYYRYREPYYQEDPAYYRERYAEPPRDYRYSRPRQSCRTKGTTGLILGGAAGALLGREVDRYGDRAPGTIIGAGAGALVGREIARKHRC